MVVAAAGQADLIVDMAVGYAPFMAEAIERGAQIMSPGDGTGSHHIEDSLIRTVLHVDLESLRREAIYVGNLFTQASELRMTSEEGSDFTLDISGIDGIPFHEFLWGLRERRENFGLVGSAVILARTQSSEVRRGRRDRRRRLHSLRRLARVSHQSGFHDVQEGPGARHPGAAIGCSSRG